MLKNLYDHDFLVKQAPPNSLPAQQSAFSYLLQRKGTLLPETFLPINIQNTNESVLFARELQGLVNSLHNEVK